MPRPLVFIHGYSATGEAFDALRAALLTYRQDRGAPLDVQNIDVCTYISLNNEITIVDIAEGLDRAFRSHPKLSDEGQEFDAIVHSTGMLVLRSWLTNHGGSAIDNPRLKRLKHLIGVAPATWGSPQASKGRTWLGALVKGDKHLGPDFMNAGNRVLDGLELGSFFTWNLAHQDLLGPHPFYSSSPNTPFVSIFIGNSGYEGVSSVANSPGADGTVRWSGCALNTRKITLDLTRTPHTPAGDGTGGERFSISPWAGGRLDVPMIAVDGRNHSTLIADPEPGMVALIGDFLDVADEDAHAAWLDRAKEYGEKGRKGMLRHPAKGVTVAGEARKFFGHLTGGVDPEEELDGWQQFVVHVIDTHGNPVDDYFLELFSVDGDTQTPLQQAVEDVHAYGVDNSFRCFHVMLPKGTAQGVSGLMVRLHASTGTELICYQGYGDTQKELTATAEPVELDISALARQAGSFFSPFTTTLVEIQLNREPLPLDQVSRILSFLPQNP